jgi:Tol biopolymer transport system component
VPIADEAVEESGVRHLPVPTVRAEAPRYAGDSLYFVSGRGTANGIWRYREGAVTEVWSTSTGTIPFPPAVSPDGSRIGFAVHRQGHSRLYAVAADGTGIRALAPEIEVRGGSAWTPDGKSLAVGGSDVRGSGLFKVPLDGSEVSRIAEGAASTPVYAPDGRGLLFHQPLAGIQYALKWLSLDGRPFSMPELWISGTREAYHFLPDGKGLVLLLGDLRQYDFWLLNLQTGAMRRLTRLNQGFTVRGFDVSSDGKEIVFERTRENADVVVIDLPI